MRVDSLNASDAKLEKSPMLCAAVAGTQVQSSSRAGRRGAREAAFKRAIVPCRPFRTPPWWATAWLYPAADLQREHGRRGGSGRGQLVNAGARGLVLDRATMAAASWIRPRRQLALPQGWTVIVNVRSLARPTRSRARPPITSRRNHH